MYRPHSKRYTGYCVQQDMQYSLYVQYDTIISSCVFRVCFFISQLRFCAS